MRIHNIWPCLALAVLLLAGCGEVPTPPAGDLPTPTPAEYPPPPTIPSVPPYTPAPTETPWPTPTPRPFTPPPTRRPIPPTRPTAVPTPVPPFPTPAFPPTPPGPPPAGLGTIWYPYKVSPHSLPVLRAVLVDGQGQRWGDFERSFPLDMNPLLGGSDWRGLYGSPDGRSFVAHIGYGEEGRSFWFDPATGKAERISDDWAHEDFLAWGPGRQVLAWNSMSEEREVWLIDLNTQEHRVFSFPHLEFNYGVRAVAVSPDGLTVADASVFGPTASYAGTDVEIGLRSLAGGDRTVAASFHVAEGADVPPHLLTWAPNGKMLALTVCTGMFTGSDDDAQLWLIKDNTATMLTRGLTVYHPVCWSPDGQYIAFIRAESPVDVTSRANLWLFDPATSTEAQLTFFTDASVTAVDWAPDGQRLVFAVTLGDHGEIRIVSVDGTRQFPVAGPTAPWWTPVIWLPPLDGGQ